MTRDILLWAIFLSILILIVMVGYSTEKITLAISNHPIRVERTVNYDIKEDFYNLIKEINYERPK